MTDVGQVHEAWRFIEHFRLPPAPVSTPSWTSALAFAAAGRTYAEAQVGDLAALLARSDALLGYVGGDPCRFDWRGFRPLRLSREEDWSDWLAHLLAASETGGLALDLFGAAGVDDSDLFIRPREVRREWIAGGSGYRADIVVVTHDQQWLHVEVKVGDLALKKTFGTSEAIRERADGAGYIGDFILLPDSDVRGWNDVAERSSAGTPVHVITWSDVAKSLRRALYANREPIAWSVWAWTFCGAIEQTLLSHPHAPPGSVGVRSLADLDGARSLRGVLKDALPEEAHR